MQLDQIIKKIEKEIISFYDLKHTSSASHHLINFKDKDLNSVFFKSLNGKRAATLVQEKSNYLFIGIYFEDDIIEHISKNNPLIYLHNGNLDHFLVLLEEISHFHLLISRAQQNRKISQLELEWQGEIDKILFAAHFLYEQCGHAHLNKLIELLFNKCIFTSPEETYKHAQYYAAKFWELATKYQFTPPFSEQFKNFMINNYHRPLHEKFPFSNSEINAHSITR